MEGKLRNMASIYISKGNRMLLLYRQGSRVVNDLWVGSAGGHFEENELNDAKACILRELKEEINVDESQIYNLKLRYITLRRTKGEVRQNYYFFADLKDNISIDFKSNEGILKWFDYKELSSVEMPFTSRFVLDHYIKEGIKSDSMYGGVADGERVVFTNLPEF